MGLTSGFANACIIAACICMMSVIEIQIYDDIQIKCVHLKAIYYTLKNSYFLKLISLAYTIADFKSYKPRNFRIYY